MLRLILDSTELHNDFTFCRKNLRTLFYLAETNKCFVHFPAPVVAEITRQHDEAADAQEIAFERVQRRFGLALSITSGIPATSETMRRVFSKRLSEIEQKPNVLFEPYPKIDHASLVARDLGARRPFQRKDESDRKRYTVGYRD